MGPRSRWNIVLLIAVAIPAIAACVIPFRQSACLPYFDDYHAILSFAMEYQQQPTWASKLLLITDYQSNEYKLIFEHIIVAAELELTHHLSFRFLIALGNLFPFPIAWLLWRIHRSESAQPDSALLTFLPVSWLMFSLTYWEALDWAMTALAHLPAIFFTLLSIKLLIPGGTRNLEPSRLLFACVAAALALFSSANGIILAPIGFFILMRRKAYTASLMWTATFLICLAVYVQHFKLGHHLWIPFAGKLFYFFAFLGCAIPNILFAVLLGIALATAFGFSVYFRFERTHPVTFYFTLWLFLTAGLVGWVRGGISSRYSMYSVLMLIFVYKFLVDFAVRRKVRFERFLCPSLALAVTLCVCADSVAYKELRSRGQILRTGMKLYLLNPSTNSPLADLSIQTRYPDEAEFERVALERAIQSHIYSLPMDLSTR